MSKDVAHQDALNWLLAGFICFAISTVYFNFIKTRILYNRLSYRNLIFCDAFICLLNSFILYIFYSFRNIK